MRIRSSSGRLRIAATISKPDPSGNNRHSVTTTSKGHFFNAATADFTFGTQIGRNPNLDNMNATEMPIDGQGSTSSNRQRYRLARAVRGHINRDFMRKPPF